MGRIADGLKAVESHAFSPDGFIEAKVRAGSDTRLRFTADSFERYVEADLEWQLTELLRRLAAKQWKGREQVLLDAGFEVYDVKRPHWHSRAREFDRRRRDLAVKVSSPRGWIILASKGMSRFKLAIPDGTLAEADEEGFRREFRMVVVQLTREFAAAVAELHRESFEGTAGR